MKRYHPSLINNYTSCNNYTSYPKIALPPKTEKIYQPMPLLKRKRPIESVSDITRRVFRSILSLSDHERTKFIGVSQEGELFLGYESFEKARFPLDGIQCFCVWSPGVFSIFDTTYSCVEFSLDEVRKYLASLQVATADLNAAHAPIA